MSQQEPSVAQTICNPAPFHWELLLQITQPSTLPPLCTLCPQASLPSRSVCSGEAPVQQAILLELGVPHIVLEVPQWGWGHLFESDPCGSLLGRGSGHLQESGLPAVSHQQASWSCPESRVRSSMTSGFSGTKNMFWSRVDLGITMSPPEVITGIPVYPPSPNSGTHPRVPGC